MTLLSFSKFWHCEKAQTVCVCFWHGVPTAPDLAKDQGSVLSTVGNLFRILRKRPPTTPTRLSGQGKPYFWSGKCAGKWTHRQEVLGGVNTQTGSTGKNEHTDRKWTLFSFQCREWLSLFPLAGAQPHSLSWLTSFKRIGGGGGGGEVGGGEEERADHRGGQFLSHVNLPSVFRMQWGFCVSTRFTKLYGEIATFA